ncbi:NADH-quinone oxidoreductase subunit C [Yimella sp. cx-51]|uniref:NADH-quinone oxidoreductase subunit C n=1 Tax=Yimella sp. cx-51 TaxID=2770551 RepID=UPI00165DAABD|nr:NADH-quinone oxidoreductase subunit C [Yimella sp. cx-51]MBC9956282.1 NADH-quinone oxidoreductase subunit C [Yimella sp. cx-51]QTH38579.1 NADH-quinone oxidoreductase subunit C [Yimella sp. cx-51]
MSENDKNDIPKDAVTGPVVEPPTERKSETELAQEDGRAGIRETHDPVLVAERTGMFGSSLGNDTSGYGGLDRPVFFPGQAQRPYGGWFDQLADDLASALQRTGGPDFAEAVTRVVVDRGELTLFVDRAHLLAVAQLLRDEAALRFEMCMGVSGVHYPQETGHELHAVYHLLSITNGSKRIRLEVTTPEGDPHLPSVVSVWPGADWHERETWDMFGLIFEGHPALTRILMPDDWPGHPQRKDYPLGGIPVEYKGATVPPADERRSYS